jgi:hypothetical protein
MLGDYMDNPAMKPILDYMLSNPAYLNQMMQAPQMQEMLKSHPEMREAFSDPAYLRELLSNYMNPKLRDEMMRNTGKSDFNARSFFGQC